MAEQLVRVGRRIVEVSSLEKPYFPEANFTKGDLLDYYVRIADVLLPHLKDRPLTLKRYPHGVRGRHFYEKDAPPHAPEWVKTFSIARKEPKPGDTSVDYVLVNDLPTLVWSIDISNIEMHTFLAKAPRIERPTSLVFDLDPGAPADIIDCCRVAISIRELFGRLEMESFVKVSGSKGLQVYVPLNVAVTYEVTRSLARTVAEHLASQQPGEITAGMSKSLRSGKVFVDWGQNDDFKTTVSPYSVRAKSEAPFVSLPVAWKEIERAIKRNSPAALYFSPAQAVSRLEKLGDLFEPVLRLKQKLPKAFESAVREKKAKQPAPTRAGKGIQAYEAKRNFARTVEPLPSSGAEKTKTGALFVIQKHKASHLHYDLRLEMEGVLRSWAVPKGLSTKAGERRLAMHVEDHPLEYGDFEGMIPPGNYGAGTVMVWDTGTYTTESRHPVRDFYAGKLHVTLSGKKLKGDWALVRTGDENKWYIIKTGKDARPISAKRDDRSALTGRTLTEIAEQDAARRG